MLRSNWLRPTLGAVAILSLILAGAVAVRRTKRQSRSTAAARYRRPSVVTSFSTISLLKQLVADTTLGFTTAEREDLATAIRQLEDHYFTRPEAAVVASTNGHCDLDALVGGWLHKAARPI